ncbi:MAG TPA: serine/threonine-protein kinase [Polyangia bacterium]|nr:serine/threonine-protein kinase [Polyangia bacterium]
MTNGPQSSEILPPGTMLGGTYRLARLLGEGGMGAVYEAYHASAGKRVAVKVMHRGLLAYPELSARFRREAKVTSELNHPNVVKVYDLGFGAAGEPYLVMEFLEGEDLQTRLERGGPLPLATVVQIVNQVAAALAEAHTASIVHRDLKPDNVFLVGGPDAAVFAKVVDFGISKVLKVSATKLTVARALIGTPEFMAPEQAEGRHDQIDHRTDQWSLACVAWVALTGCLPFSGPDANATLNQVISAVPIPPAPGAPRIPPEVEAVLRRAMSRRALDRFPTIRAFARYFEGAASQVQGVQGVQPAVAAGAPDAVAEPGRERPAPRRRPVLTLAIVVAVSLPIVAGAAWLLRDRPPISTYLQGARALIQRR